VEFPINIWVDQADAPKSIQATVRGRDTRTGSVLSCTLRLTLAPSAEGSSLGIMLDFTLSGSLVSLGYSVMKRRADEMVAQFLANLERAFVSHTD
jgi:carbon monoxide dehydrogenase subunit G